MFLKNDDDWDDDNILFIFIFSLFILIYFFFVSTTYWHPIVLGVFKEATVGSHRPSAGGKAEAGHHQEAPGTQGRQQ